jgi:hypothetical protein
MIIKESQVGSLEQLMPTVYNKLKTLGEINDVVPLANIMNGLQSGEARAYVSNEDKNQDGIPDRINIVYPKMNIDLRQHLDGVTTADIMAFPNIDSSKAHDVMNIMAAVLEVLHHEQDHLSGFKSTEDSSGNITDEFSSESSADGAGGGASSAFINRWSGKFASTTNSYSNIAKCFNLKGEFKMQKDLVKLANHLDEIGHRDLADKLDSIVAKINKTAQAAQALSVGTQVAVDTMTEPLGAYGQGTLVTVIPYHYTDPTRSGNFNHFFSPNSMFNGYDPEGTVNSQWARILADPKKKEFVASVIRHAERYNEEHSSGGQMASGAGSLTDDEQAMKRYGYDADAWAALSEDEKNEMRKQISQRHADDNAVTASSKLDGIFSVNPVGKVSR